MLCKLMLLYLRLLLRSITSSPMVYKSQQLVEAQLKYTSQFEYIIVKDLGMDKTLWKSHYELLGSEDPVCKLHGDLFRLKSWCGSSCEHQVDAVLYTELHLADLLLLVFVCVPFTGILCTHRVRIWLFPE